MPSSTPERQARWTDDGVASKFLESRGFTLTSDWTWHLPSPGHVVTADETDAITYLIEEWDYGGYVPLSQREQELVRVTALKVMGCYLDKAGGDTTPLDQRIIALDLVSEADRDMIGDICAEEAGR